MLHSREEKQWRIISLVSRDVSAYYSNLHAGFSELGIHNKFFFEVTHSFYRYPGERDLCEKIITKAMDFILSSKGKKSLLLKIITVYPFVWAIKFIYFLKLLYCYDVFIFGANYSYLGLYSERYLIKLFHKKIIDMSTGSDVRPPYLNGAFVDSSVKKLVRVASSKANRLKRKYRYGDFIVDYPSVSQFNKKTYISHLYVGFPAIVSYGHHAKSIQNEIRDKKPLILHAPSSPKIKGTDIIRQVIAELQEEYGFDYEELTDVPNKVVLQKMQECSFVINQLYSDALMSGVDTEAACFGKPSIVGGYNLEWIKSTVVGYDVPPTYMIKPDKEELKNAIIHLLTDEAYRKNLGQSAREFVQKNWSAKCVAQKYLDIINGDIPKGAWRSPHDDLDIYGCGLRIKDRNRMVRSMVEKYGSKSLCLDDKAELKKTLLNDCGL